MKARLDAACVAEAACLDGLDKRMELIMHGIDMPSLVSIASNNATPASLIDLRDRDESKRDVVVRGSAGADIVFNNSSAPAHINVLDPPDAAKPIDPWPRTRLNGNDVFYLKRNGYVGILFLAAFLVVSRHMVFDGFLTMLGSVVVSTEGIANAANSSLENLVYGHLLVRRGLPSRICLLG